MKNLTSKSFPLGFMALSLGLMASFFASCGSGYKTGQIVSGLNSADLKTVAASLYSPVTDIFLEDFTNEPRSRCTPATFYSQPPGLQALDEIKL